MIRTQVQLEESQLKALRRLAASEQVSVAEMMRRLVEEGLARRPRRGGAEERLRRALAIVGRYRSRRGDTAVQHDRDLAEAFRT